MGYCAYCGDKARSRCMSCGNEICLSHQSGGFSVSDHHGRTLLQLVQFALANRPLRNAPLEFDRSVQCNDCADKPHRAALAQAAELVRDLPPKQALLTLVYAASYYDHLKTTQQSVMEIWNTLGRPWPGSRFLTGVLNAFLDFIVETGTPAPGATLQLTYWAAPGLFSGLLRNAQSELVHEEIACAAGWVFDLESHIEDGPHPYENRCAFLRSDGQLYYGSHKVSDSGQIESHVRTQAGWGFSGENHSISRKEEVKHERRRLQVLAQHLSRDKQLDANIDCHLCEMGLASGLAELWWQLAHTTNR